MKRAIPICVVSVVVDQLVKYLISTCMKLGESISILGDFFRISYVRNEGAAFSIMIVNKGVLIFTGFMTLVLLYFIIFWKKERTKYEQIIYGILCGGIVGNMVDRIIYGAVIDYLDFKIFGYNFPVFNIADICIVVSVALISFTMLKGEKNGSSR